MQHESKLIVASFFNPNISNCALRRCVAKRLEISVCFFRHVDWRRGKAESAEIAQSSMHKSPNGTDAAFLCSPQSQSRLCSQGTVWAYTRNMIFLIKILKIFLEINMNRYEQQPITCGKSILWIHLNHTAKMEHTEMCHLLMVCISL